ncbi:precorrin-6y C5,15-methyltransferase (decarboxylating) subunit CbiE [Allostreptomyces psammosilenae]|uniref:Precorrin-6Y C5,15-methyltransferase (Decarboxylating) n=1 Tax=Allostreptomyces psammosilenae TaxID=1892865 RepID=A0A853A165_9ACTN|nr:precorrin-6y C5,15-methyltransferase (decarboxylating) subunit CbiE [Allostreptomyces psammosilenae]NYI04148.1 precorrin-6Y C5,15-methyltransferase (decarboxylating) [Allostreptomyces psammosilenae]
MPALTPRPHGPAPAAGPTGRARITVLGCGTSPGETVPPAAREALGRATLLLGARRHLTEHPAAAAVPPGTRRVVLGPLAPALDAVAERLRGGDGQVVVLASGDPGFFGIVRALAERFGAEALDVHPSVPSVARAFARTGLTWDDAAVVSAHGRELRTAVNVCRAHPKTAVLTGPGAGPAELGAALRGTDRLLVVGTDLGGPGERLERVTPEQAAARNWPAVSVVLCLDPDPARWLSPRPAALAGPPRPGDAPTGGAGRPPGPHPGWALPEDAFEHRDSMITKAEVRALALARLAPRPGTLVWDIGSGSGSVAVECARLGSAVTAVERDPEQVRRITANAAAHGVPVTVVHGSAPEALPELTASGGAPDAVFVGGGGIDAVAACAAVARRAVVVTLAAIDRVPAARAALGAAGLAVDGVLLQSSRLAPLPGDAWRLAATNPVFVLWGVRDHPPAPGPGPVPEPDHAGGWARADAPPAPATPPVPHHPRQHRDHTAPPGEQP